MIRRDFFEIVDYCVEPRRRREVLDQRGVHRRRGRPPAGGDGLPRRADQPRRHRRRHQRRVRGDGSYATARRAMDHLADAGFGPFKISVVVTRHNVDQLDEFKALADSYGAQLRVTRLRPSGRGADTWHELHPTNEQQRRSTAGCSPTARTCSPATRSSTSTRSASRCPGSTCAAPAGSCASSTRSATCTPARS